MNRLFRLLLAASFPLLCLQASDVVLTIPDGGIISVAPGDTSGWGFTLGFASDLNQYFAVVTSSDFCVGAQVSPCSNSLGTYTDIISTEYPLVFGPAPESQTISQSYDFLGQAGLGSFSVSPDAVGGDSLSGSIFLTYDLFGTDSDALNGGTPIAFDQTISAPATVDVASNAPEPASGLLLFGPIVACLGARRLRVFFTGIGCSALASRQQTGRSLQTASSL